MKFYVSRKTKSPLMKRYLVQTILATAALIPAGAAIQLNPLWEIPAGEDTNVFPSYGIPTGGNSFDRGLAYNPISGNLIVPTRSGGSPGYRVLVLSKDRTNNPADPVNAIRELSLANSDPLAPPVFLTSGPNFTVMQAGVGDDGAVYVCNLIVSAGQAPNFRIYRWQSDAVDTVETPNRPYAAFSGNPDSSGTVVRWGDIMAVRGSGANTRILMGTNTGGVTSVALLTTTNGLDFTSTIIPGALQGAPCRGLTWGPPGENSFYSKSNSASAPIRKTTFTLTPAPAVTATVDSTASSAVTGGLLGPLFYHHASKRIAVLDLTTSGFVAGQPWPFNDKDFIRLHDINQTTGAVIVSPVVATRELTQETLVGTAGNGNAGNGNQSGQVAIGDGRIFVCSTNKGIQAFTIFDDNLVSPPVATILPPAGTAVWTRGQLTLTGSATGTPPISFAWLKNDVVIDGQSASTLTLNPVTAADAGAYKFRATNSAGPNTSAAVNITTPASLDTSVLTKQWQLAPGSRPWLNSGDTERGMDVNPTLGRMYVVSRSPALSVQVLDSANGNAVGTLDTTGITGGTFPLNMIGVAADGRIYACNLTDGTTPLQIYRWADDSPTTLPEIAFTGNPIPGRLGDTIDVRGRGNATEIVIGSRNADSYVVFKLDALTDPALWVGYPITGTTAPNGAFGLGLAFGNGNEVFGKSITLQLVRTSFDTAGGTGSLLATSAVGQILGTNAGLAFDPVSNLIGISGIELSDSVRLYRVLDAGAGTLEFLDQEFYATDNININGTGAAAFAGGKLYTLNTNNGLIAFNISLAAAPTLTNFVRSGNNFSFTLTGVTGGSYLIQRSPDMATWADDGIVTLSVGTSVTVTRTVTDGRYFFRAKAL